MNIANHILDYILSVYCRTVTFFCGVEVIRYIGFKTILKGIAKY